MRQGLRTLGLVAGILLFAVAQSAPPDGKGRPVLDQFNTEAADSAIDGGFFQYEWQQGVTVGISEQLTRLDFYVRADGATGFHGIVCFIGPALAIRHARLVRDRVPRSGMEHHQLG